MVSCYSAITSLNTAFVAYNLAIRMAAKMGFQNGFMIIMVYNGYSPCGILADSWRFCIDNFSDQFIDDFIHQSPRSVKQNYSFRHAELNIFAHSLTGLLIACLIDWSIGWLIVWFTIGRFISSLTSFCWWRPFTRAMNWTIISVVQCPSSQEWLRIAWLVVDHHS